MSFVCFIRVKGDNTSPILIAEDPVPSHLLALAQAGNPNELAFMGKVDSRLYPLKWWYDTLGPWHLRGTWYAPRPQVLCFIEDALSGSLEPVGRIDPLEDEETLLDPSERVPDDVLGRIKAAEQAIKDRWAFPKPDPYPVPKSRPVPIAQASSLIRKLLQAPA